VLKNPDMSYNERTGAYRIRLVNGNPVPVEDCAYQVLSMLTEDPGGIYEETPRPGNLVEALAETTRRTRGDTKAAVDVRLRPLVDDGLLIDARCQDVDVVDLETGGRGIAFSATIQKPGQSPGAVQVQLRGT
jgi:hypothetical protein